MKYGGKETVTEFCIMRKSRHIETYARNVIRHCIFVPTLCIGLSTLYSKDVPELRLNLLRPLAQGFTYSEHQSGLLYAAPCESSDGQEVGAMLIWRPSDGGKLISVETLSSLDEVLRKQVSNLGEHLEKSGVLRLISPALGEYVRLQSWGFILFPWECKNYLTQMKPHVSEAVYERVKERLVYPFEEMSKEAWMIPLIVRKTDGAIELNRFYGSVDPFSIDKREVEIIARVGLIPRFDYVRPEPNRDQSRSEQP